VRNITQQKEQDAAFRLDLGGYARILWRKKYFLLVPLAISFIVASIGVRFLVPEYESSSLIRIGNASSAGNNEVTRFLEGRGGRDRNEKTLVQLQTDILGSNFLDELIRQIGLDREPEVIARAELQHAHYPALTTEELIFRRLRDFMRRRVKIEAEGPDLFRISYADANPDACFVIADAITQLYIDMQRRQKMQGLRDVSEFSEEQQAVYKERLERSERELTDYQERVAARTVGTANPVHERNVASTASRNCSIGSVGKGLPVRSRTISLNSSVIAARSSAARSASFAMPRTPRCRASTSSNGSSGSPSTTVPNICTRRR